MNDDDIERPNFSELSRITGITRQTLSKRWNNPFYKEPPPRRPRKGKYDKYGEEIKVKFLRTSNMSAVFHYFKNKYPETFRSYEGFRYFCQKNGMVTRRIDNQVHVRYETTFGDQVQVDWKEDLQIITHHGEVIIFNLYVMVFSASRKKYLCIAFQKTTEEFFRCTIETLIRAGGCPESLLTDNMSAIVNHHTNELLEPVREFLKDMGFDIQRCKPFHAFTKGKVESANRFAQWLDPYKDEIETVEDLYKVVGIIERQINQEVNNTTGFTPDALFPADQKVLKPLPREELMDYWLHSEVTDVPNTLLVDYQKNSYSVPYRLYGKYVKLVPCSETLYIYRENEVVRVHSLNQEGSIHYNENDYVEGLAGSMGNTDRNLIEEQARKNLELIAQMGRRKDEN